MSLVTNLKGAAAAKTLSTGCKCSTKKPVAVATETEAPFWLHLVVSQIGAIFPRPSLVSENKTWIPGKGKVSKYPNNWTDAQGDLSSKISMAAGNVTQLIEWLSSSDKVLGSIPSTV